MEPTVGAAALKAGLAAIQQLPKLAAQSGRVSAERRLTAYERFTAAVWSVVESDASARAIQPIAGKTLGGFWYHPMFVRVTERALASHGELLGAYGALRVLAPDAIVNAASEVADCLGDLAAVAVGDHEQHAKQQNAVGLTMLPFELLSRIDLGIERHPSASRMGWTPASWLGWAKWWWRARRGDWPTLPVSVRRP